MPREGAKANLAQADYIAPAGSGLADWLGGFVVTAGDQVEERARDFAQAGDMYSSILLKALADRLAEAFAERMHERGRKELWAYAPDERLPNDQLVSEADRGIRRAPGHPARPDHPSKDQCAHLLGPRGGTG